MKKAQVAIEYLMIIAVAFAILLPLFYFSGERSSSLIRTSQLESAVNTLSKTADTVYGLGPGSKKTVTITIPQGVNESLLINNNVVYRLLISGEVDQIHATSKASLIGELPKEAGTYKIYVEMLEGGLVRIGLNSSTSGTASCLTYDTLAAHIDDDELEGVDIKNGCSEALTLTKIRVTWDNSKKIKEVKFQNSLPSWENNCNWGCSPKGAEQNSGVLLDFGDRDYVLDSGATREIDKLRFNGVMPSTEFIIILVLSDDSSRSSGLFTAS